MKNLPIPADWCTDCFDESYIEFDRLIHSPELNALQAKQIIDRLEIRRPERLLDVCCGYGRYLLPLAACGYRISGIDSSQAMLRALEEDAFLQNLVINANRGDMRHIPFHQYFHGVFLAGTSFGVFEDLQEDRKTLASIRQCLLPGGRFLIDQSNAEKMFCTGDSHRKIVNLGTQTVTEHVQLDSSGDFYTIHRHIQRGSWSRDWFMRFRCYHAKQLAGLLKESGFRPLSLFGDLGGSPYTPESTRLIIVCERQD